MVRKKRSFGERTNKQKKKVSIFIFFGLFVISLAQDRKRRP
jgi:hypothetical protein